jgi:hypothetical protein
VRRTYRPETPEGAAHSSYVRFLFGLISQIHVSVHVGRTTKPVG